MGIHRKSVLCLSLYIFLTAPLYAQTVQWALRPTSAHIENYGNLLKVRKNGKSGLTDMKGNQIVPVAYDSISPFLDGFALVMNNVSKSLKIEGILAEGDTEMLIPTETVFATRYMWFSDGKMPVRGNDGWGYMGTDANMVIPCQFQEAHPFSEGFASVKIDNKAYYITGDMNYLSVEAGYGNIVFASTFSGQEAVVFSGDSYTPKGYVINRKGRIIRRYRTSPEDMMKNELNRTDHSVGDKARIYHDQVQQLAEDKSYEIYQENGLYGYKKNGTIVLPAQLDRAEPVRGEFANVQYKGQNGVLQFVDGAFASQLETNEIKVVGGEVKNAYLQINLPAALADASVRLRMTDGQGHEMPVVANSTQGERRQYNFRPVNVPEKSASDICQLELWSGDLLLWKDKVNITYSVSRPAASTQSGVVATTTVGSQASSSESNLRIASFTISNVKETSTRANPKDIFYVTVTVHNSGDRTGVANVTLYVDGGKMGTKRVNVRGRSSSPVKFVAATQVKKERYAKVRAVLQDGKSSQNQTILITPFY